MDLDISLELELMGGKEEDLEFVAQSSDYNNCVDVAFRILMDEEPFKGHELCRGHLARIPKASIPKLIAALTPFLPAKLN